MIKMHYEGRVVIDYEDDEGENDFPIEQIRENLSGFGEVLQKELTSLLDDGAVIRVTTEVATVEQSDQYYQRFGAVQTVPPRHYSE